MKDFFYNRNDNSFAFMADGWHFENLPTNRNCLNFRALSEQVFLNSDSRVCVCLLTRTRPVSTASFATLSSSASRVRLGFSIELVDKRSGFAESETSRPPSFGSLTTAAPTLRTVCANRLAYLAGRKCRPSITRPVYAYPLAIL